MLKSPGSSHSGLILLFWLFNCHKSIYAPAFGSFYSICLAALPLDESKLFPLSSSLSLEYNLRKALPTTYTK